MTRLYGGMEPYEEPEDNDPRRLAADVPRGGEQRHHLDEGEAVDERHEGTPTDSARPYDDNRSISRVDKHKPRRRSRSVW